MSASAPRSSLHWPSVCVGAAAAILTSAATAGALWAAPRLWHRARRVPKSASTASSAPPLPVAGAASSEGAALLDFLLLVGRCKVEKRTGWVDCGVPLAESVADHQYRMALMALSCADEAALRPSSCTCTGTGAPSSGLISPARAVRMALVHDLAECITSDITPTQFSGVSKEQKHRMEEEAMKRILTTLQQAHATSVQGTDAGAASTASPSSDASLPFSGVCADILSLWEEYEAGATPTAQFVKNLDKLEMYVQAYEYQQAALERGTEEGRRLQRKLQRFFDGMPGTREKAVAQDALVEGGKPQRLLYAVMDELQRRMDMRDSQPAV